MEACIWDKLDRHFSERPARLSPQAPNAAGFHFSELTAPMRVGAELDSIRAERLARLQARFWKPLPEALAEAIDLALAKLARPDSTKLSVREARSRFEREQGILTEEFELPPRKISMSTWQNSLDD